MRPVQLVQISIDIPVEHAVVVAVRYAPQQLIQE
jgi:hypothetical protein